MTAIVAPLPQFFDITGLPLNNGSVWIGEPNQNPETSPASVYWDEALTQPAQQPLLTKNGLIVRSGTAAPVYLSGDYSMTVKNAAGVQVFYARSAAAVNNGLAVETLRADILSAATGKGAAIVGTQGAAPGSVARTQQDKNEDTASLMNFGAAGNGTTDDSAALAAAAVSGRAVVDGDGRTFRLVSRITFSAPITLRNARLLFDGPITSRLCDITGSDVTFEGVTFDGNNKQPRYSLVYVAADVLRPKFRRCKFVNMYGTATGATLVNQMAALNINPYGVVGFEVEGCEFRNLRKLNDGSIVPQTVGFGFVGGVYFNTEDGSDPAASQATPSQGIISNSQFDTIKTILATGLSDNDVSLYDDGDGIRTIEGAGAKRLYVDITGCTFRNVSKRAVKLRASGGTFSDSTIVASLGAYGMSTPIDLVNGCWADNIRLITSSALPVLKVATLANSGDMANLPLSFGVRGITCGHAKVGVELTSAGAVPMAGMVVQDVKIGACSDRGFLTTGTAPSTQSNMVIDDFQIVGSGNNCAAIRASAAADSTGGWFISGVVTQNADVKVEGTNNVLRGSRFRFTSTSYAGFNATGALVEFGSGKGLGGESVVEDVTIDAAGISTGYLSATRPYLTLFTSDSMTIKGLKIIAPDGLSNSYSAFEGVGDDVVIDGFDYFGASFCRHGSLVASSLWTVKNAVRRGNGACSVPFWSLAAAAQFYEFSNITDFRPTTQPTINSSTATNGIASVVNTRSSHVSGGVAGVAKTAAVNTF